MALFKRKALQWGRDDDVAEDPENAKIVGEWLALQWGRDDDVAEDGASVEDQQRANERFNGAATMTSRKTHGPEGMGRPRAELQWGRDDDVAEDLSGVTVSFRGKSLQWGRDDDVAEDMATITVPYKIMPLQWGRDDDVAEDWPTSSGRRRRIASLQWGRDDDVAEDERHHIQQRAREQASMGPRR